MGRGSRTPAQQGASARERALPRAAGGRPGAGGGGVPTSISSSGLPATTKPSRCSARTNSPTLGWAAGRPSGGEATVAGGGITEDEAELHPVLLHEDVGQKISLFVFLLRVEFQPDLLHEDQFLVVAYGLSRVELGSAFLSIQFRGGYADVPDDLARFKLNSISVDYLPDDIVFGEGTAEGKGQNGKQG